MRNIFLIILVLAAASGGAAWWWLTRHNGADRELVLYGNVDLRQVLLAFNNSERIVEIKKDAEEGKQIKVGQVLAVLDTSRLLPQVAQAEAQVAAQKQVYNRLASGSRPEEKAQARANLAIANVEADNNRQQYSRMIKSAVVQLSDKSEARAVSQEAVDNAKAALDKADANVVVSQKALDLVLAGPRKEDVAEAKATLQDKEAKLAFLNQQLVDAKLVSPVNAVIRTRLMETGEMASPLKPIFSLAIIDPKWIRTYVSERDLGKVREGMKASIAVDSFPDHRFEGEVGFISNVAEFTPKAVQTEELRTNLVYEVRVFVRDPENQLRLGMPATVHLPKE